tara:strand:- start:894 stop:1091 length:198 start_codon:yes stop_codon:yes gene_type:complete
MTSTLDGSQAEEQAKAFARQYAKEFQQEKENLNAEIVDARKYDPLRGDLGQDLKSKIQSGEIKII